MVGRNPYVRLLSAFLTNQAHEGQDEDAEKVPPLLAFQRNDVFWILFCAVECIVHVLKYCRVLVLPLKVHHVHVKLGARKRHNE